MLIKYKYFLVLFETATFASEKKQAKPEELEEVQKQLIEMPKKEIKKPKLENISDKNTWLPIRIP